MSSLLWKRCRYLMKRILFAISLLLIPFACYANKFDIYLMGGPAVSKISNDNSVRINQYMVNKYNTDSRSQIQPVLGVGIAHTFVNFNKPISLSLGLSGYYAYFGKIKGTEYPFANDGIFDSLNYQFNAQALSAMIESRLTYTQCDWQPYGIVGVGASWNRLYSYSETPTIPSESAAPSPYPFANHTNASFAYELGVGVQRQIYNDPSRQLQYFLSLEYRYMNFGKGELGPSSVQTSSNRLQVSNLDTQAVLLSLKVTI